jgi:hypothetical protein
MAIEMLVSRNAMNQGVLLHYSLFQVASFGVFNGYYVMICSTHHLRT